MKGCGGNENLENIFGENRNEKFPNVDPTQNTMLNKRPSKNETEKSERKVTEKQKISICSPDIFPNDRCSSVEGMIETWRTDKCQENKTQEEKKDKAESTVAENPNVTNMYNNNFSDCKNAGDILPQMFSQRSFIDQPMFKPPTSNNSEFAGWAQHLESKSEKEVLNRENKLKNLSYSVCTDRKRKVEGVTDNNKNQTGWSLALNEKSRRLLPHLNQTCSEGKGYNAKDIGNSSFEAILDEVYIWSKNRNSGKLLRRDVSFKNVLDDVYEWSRGKLLTRSRSSEGISIQSSSSCSIHYSIPNCDKLRSMRHADKHKKCCCSGFKNQNMVENNNCAFKQVRFSTECNKRCLQRPKSDVKIRNKYQNVCSKNCKFSSQNIKMQNNVNCKQKLDENKGKPISYKDTLLSLNKCIHSGFNLAAQVSNGVQNKELWTKFFDTTNMTSQEAKRSKGKGKNSLLGYCVESKKSTEPSFLEILACGQETPVWENSSSSLTSTVISTPDCNQYQNNVLEKHGWKKFPLEELPHISNVCSDDTETPMWASCMSTFDTTFSEPESVQMKHLWNSCCGNKMNKRDSSVQQKMENPAEGKCSDNSEKKYKAQGKFLIMSPQLPNGDNAPFVKICVMNNVNQNTKLIEDIDFEMQSKQDHDNYLSPVDTKKFFPSLHHNASLISSNSGKNAWDIQSDSLKPNMKCTTNPANALYNSMRIEEEEEENSFIIADKNHLVNQDDRNAPCSLPEYLPSDSQVNCQNFETTKNAIQAICAPGVKSVVNSTEEKEIKYALGTQNGSLNKNSIQNEAANNGDMKNYCSHYDTTVPLYSILEISNIKWETYIDNFNRENDLSCLLKTIIAKLRGLIKITGGNINCFCTGNCPSAITNLDPSFLLKIIELNNNDANEQVFSYNSGVCSNNDVVDKSIECLILVNDNKDKCTEDDKEGNVGLFNQKVELVSGENGMCIPNYIVNAIENFDWEPLIPGFNKESDLPMLVEVIGSKLNEIFVFSDNGTSCLCNLPKMALELTASQMIAIISKSLKKIQNLDKKIFYKDLSKVTLNSDCNNSNVNLVMSNLSEQSMKSYVKRQTFFNQIISSIDTDLKNDQHGMKKEPSCNSVQEKKKQSFCMSYDLSSKDSLRKKPKEFSRKKKRKSTKIKSFQHVKHNKKPSEQKTNRRKKKSKPFSDEQRSLVEIPCYDICDIEDIDWECYLLDFDRKKDMKFLLRTIRSKLKGVINISGNNNECVCCAKLPPAFCELDPYYLYYIIECNAKPIEIHTLSTMSLCSKENVNPLDTLKEQEERLECLEKLLLRRIVKLYAEKNNLIDLEASNDSDSDSVSVSVSVSVSDSCSQTETELHSNSNLQNVKNYAGQYCDDEDDGDDDDDDDDDDQKMQVYEIFKDKKLNKKDKINVNMKPGVIAKENYNKYLKKSDNIDIPLKKDFLQITNHQLSDASEPSRICFINAPYRKHKSSKINVCKKDKANYYSYDCRVTSKNSSRKALQKTKAGLCKINPLEVSSGKKVKNTDNLPSKLGWYKRKNSAPNYTFDDNSYKCNLGSSKRNLISRQLPKTASKYHSPLNLISTGQPLSKKLAKSTSNLQNAITKPPSKMAVNSSNTAAYFRERLELLKKEKPKDCEKETCPLANTLKIKPIIRQKFKLTKGKNSRMKFV